MNYFDVPALSASLAKQLIRSAAHGKYYMDNPKKPTAAMQFGTAVHAAVLEPDKQAFVIRPDDLDRRTKDGKARYAELEAAGLPILTQDDANAVEIIRRKITAIELVADSLKSGKTEVERYWRGRLTECKAKADLVAGSTIFDIKTTTDASPNGFDRACRTYNYAMQAQHYLNGFGAEKFIFIAVETEPPYAVGLYTLAPYKLTAAQNWLDLAEMRYEHGLRTGVWPGYMDIPVELGAFFNSDED